ncbi:MAG: aldo/keto reductase, partial [Chloroflexi bacterium]|nr:aldo/keto reductase [Chloroflexota bacterium]
GLMQKAAQKGIGTVAIRILAAGALTGSSARHPIAAQNVAPMATGRSLDEDIARTSVFEFLVNDGYVDSLVEAAIRFAISSESLSTALVGLSSFDQLEQAVTYTNKGPLPADALVKLEGTWAAL